MISDLKREAARRRWKRAISAVRLGCTLVPSRGGPPEWDPDNPVRAPGREGRNRFVDANEMESEATRKRQKRFREGRVMRNLVESGIQMVWFSYMSQNDAVYGA